MYLPEFLRETDEREFESVTTVRRIPLRLPYVSGWFVEVLRVERDGRTYFVWTGPDRAVDGSAMLQSAAEKRAMALARDLEEQARRERFRELFDSERSRVQTMTQDEIVTEGCGHSKYHIFWETLRNPLILMPDQCKILQIGAALEKKSMIRWVRDHDIDMKIRRLPLKTISISPRHNYRFELTVLDFATEGEAFYFKIIWM